MHGGWEKSLELCQILNDIPNVKIINQFNYNLSTFVFISYHICSVYASKICISRKSVIYHHNFYLILEKYANKLMVGWAWVCGPVIRPHLAPYNGQVCASQKIILTFFSVYCTFLNVCAYIICKPCIAIQAFESLTIFFYSQISKFQFF